MAGPMFIGDKQISRRRWVIIAALFTVVLLLFTATSHYRPLTPPPPGYSPQSASHAPQFTKPKDIPIIGLIFFGRKSRVEILRCYVEVRSTLRARIGRGKLTFPAQSG